jgi:hypothetical protein
MLKDMSLKKYVMQKKVLVGGGVWGNVPDWPKAGRGEAAGRPGIKVLTHLDFKNKLPGGERPRPAEGRSGRGRRLSWH